jgi:hypothetical protein
MILQAYNLKEAQLKCTPSPGHLLTEYMNKCYDHLKLMTTAGYVSQPYFLAPVQ